MKNVCLAQEIMEKQEDNRQPQDDVLSAALWWAAWGMEYHPAEGRDRKGSHQRLLEVEGDLGTSSWSGEETCIAKVQRHERV